MYINPNYEAEKGVFKSLVQLGNDLPFTHILYTLCTKAQCLTEVSRTSFSCSNDKKEYSEELIVDFKSGTLITATLVFDTYFWDFTPPADSSFQSIHLEIPLK